MDCPWVEMGDKYVSMNWLVKVRDRLGKVEKKQQKIKQREVFDWYNVDLTRFKFKAEFSSLQLALPNILKIHTLSPHIKDYENQREINNTYQHVSHIVEKKTLYLKT